SSRFLFLTIDVSKVFFERPSAQGDARLGVGELDQTAVLEAIHDRSRQELDLTAVFHGHAILKQHLTPLTDGRDAVDTQLCDEDPIAVLDKSLPAVDEGNDLRSRPHRSEGDGPNVHPLPHWPDAITRPVEIRRLAFDAALLDRAAVAVEAARHLFEDRAHTVRPYRRNGRHR